MRAQDWPVVVFYWLAVEVLVVDLWWQRRKRHSSVSGTGLAKS
ncbi:MAG: hypothetical protein ACXADC_10930 [Candidatus Thorarchaeota archaeon]